MGEFSSIVDGGGLLYKHIEPDASTLPFSMLVDHDDLIEGEYAYMKGRRTITYKLSYLKIFPRQNEIMVDKFPNWESLKWDENLRSTDKAGHR